MSLFDAAPSTRAFTFEMLERAVHMAERQNSRPSMMLMSRKTRTRFVKSIKWHDKPRWYRRQQEARGRPHGRSLSRKHGGRMVRV